MPVPGARGHEHEPARLDSRLLFRVEIHARLIRHIEKSSHHVGQSPPFGSCCTSPVRMRSTIPDGQLTRTFHLAPELFLGEIVVLREAGDAVLARLGTQQPTCLAFAGERAVETTQRLDADEVAQHEHVQRNLEALLGLDLLRRVRVLSRLVVLDDPAGAERVDVDAVDLPREGDALGELEATLELRCGAFRSEQHLEAAGDERHVCGGLFAHERLEVAPETVAELTPLEIGQLHAYALHRIVQAPPQETECVLDPILVRRGPRPSSFGRPE